MKYITDKEIRDLHITQQVCVDWVREAFLKKEDCILSPKISQHLSADSFFNTMPCCIPEFNRMGVKVVSRLPGNKPTSRSYINLFDLPTGELLTVMEADWITSMRTGAVAAEPKVKQIFRNRLGQQVNVTRFEGETHVV